MIHQRAIRNQGHRQLSAEVIRVSLLSAQTCESMFNLYQRYYEATSRELFFTDLFAKDQVIVLNDETDTLRGFTTLKLIDCQRREQPYRVIFSGDTIIHHRYWGEQSLAFTWIRRAGAIKAERSDIPLFWLLIVKGHRTYRYLQAFALDYYPHFRHHTPSAIQDLMDQLGRQLFSEHYQSDTGIVHFPSSRGQLRPEWSEPSYEVQERPEVKFFLQKNPGFRRGDELLCLTELSPGNLRPLARRLFEAGMNG